MGPRRGRGEMPHPLLLVFCRAEGGRSFLVLAVFPSATSALACVKGGKRKVGSLLDVRWRCFFLFFCLFGWTSPFYTTLPALGEKHPRYIAFGGKEMAAVVQ